MDLDACTSLALSLLESEVRERFATQPLEVLREDLGLTVKAADHLGNRRQDAGACDGTSFLEDGVILYAQSPNSRRENFTLAHELGHWLIEQSDDALDWIADQRDPRRVLETLCDRIAQRLLLPEGIIDSVLGTGPVRADHVNQLLDGSAASRPVCAIGLAKRLPCLGAVAIIDPVARRVQYASITPDTDSGWPLVVPWPGQEVPAGHPTLSVREGLGSTRKSFWRTPWGDQQGYYIDVALSVRRVVAVFADRDLWGSEKLHIDRPRGFDERPEADINCCGKRQTIRGYPCSDCGHPYCGICGLCRCQRSAAAEQLCAGGCFMKFRPNLLVDGKCEDCRT